MNERLRFLIDIEPRDLYPVILRDESGTELDVFQTIFGATDYLARHLAQMDDPDLDDGYINSHSI